ncbi:hypothetical protein Sjap_018130 [Stephania japonica]|uniref:S-protein homolog n=1 Tax=Stephania japonica TaxID=461633 RepID=A0AAP0I7J2_9MAGN
MASYCGRLLVMALVLIACCNCGSFVDVRVKSEITGNHVLSVHCKSKDDDLSARSLSYQQQFDWTFKTTTRKHLVLVLYVLEGLQRQTVRRRYKIRAPCDEIFGCWHFDNEAKVQATCHTLIGQKLCSANVSEAHWLRKVLVTCWCDTWCVISGNG